MEVIGYDDDRYLVQRADRAVVVKLTTDTVMRIPGSLESFLTKTDWDDIDESKVPAKVMELAGRYFTNNAAHWDQDASWIR